MRVLFVVLLVLVALPCKAIALERAEIAGAYESVSESEWNVRIYLCVEGSALVVTERWDPGDYDQREISLDCGQWYLEDDYVIIDVNGSTEKFKYDPVLPLDFMQGTRPGLISKDRKYLHLWRLPHPRFSPN